MNASSLFVRTCGKCDAFNRQAVGQPAGTCRCHPPVPIMVGVATDPKTGQQFPNVQTFWPQVPDTAGCGDWVKAALSFEFEDEPEAVKEPVI